MQSRAHCVYSTGAVPTSFVHCSAEFSFQKKKHSFELLAILQSFGIIMVEDKSLTKKERKPGSSHTTRKSAAVGGVNFHQMVQQSPPGPIEGSSLVENGGNVKDFSENTNPAPRQSRDNNLVIVDELCVDDEDDDEVEAPGAFAISGMNNNQSEQEYPMDSLNPSTAANNPSLVVAHLAPEDRDIELLNEQLDELKRQVNEQAIEEAEAPTKHVPEAKIVEEQTVCGMRRIYVLAGLVFCSAIVLAIVLALTIPDQRTPPPDPIVFRTTNAPSETPSMAPTETPKFARPPPETCEAIANGNATKSTDDLSDRIVAYGFLLEVDVYMEATENNETSVADGMYPTIDSVSEPVLSKLQKKVAPALAGCPLPADRRSLQQDMEDNDGNTSTILSVVFDLFSAKLGTCQDDDDPSCRPAKCRVRFYVVGEKNMFLEDINDLLKEHIEGISIANIQRMDLINAVQIGVTQPTLPTAQTDAPTILTVDAPSVSDMERSIPIVSTNQPKESSPTSSPQTVSTKRFFRPTLLKRQTSKPSTEQPSLRPTIDCTSSPTNSARPSNTPTDQPSAFPSLKPSGTPTTRPTAEIECLEPSETPSEVPSASPTEQPSVEPSIATTSSPTLIPSLAPVLDPTAVPTQAPVPDPTVTPTSGPTSFPSEFPSEFPTVFPTGFPTEFPTAAPTEVVTESCEETIGKYFDGGDLEETSGASETSFGGFGSESCASGGDVIVLAATEDECPVCLGIVLQVEYQCSCDDLNQWSLIVFDDLTSFGTLYYGYLDGDDSDDLSCPNDIVFANC